jgi:hypothetical protein
MRYSPWRRRVHRSLAYFPRGLQTPICFLLVVGVVDRHPGVDCLVGGLQRQGELEGQEVVVQDEEVPDALRGTVDD